MKALVLDQFGSPDVPEYREIESPSVRSGEGVVRMVAIGLSHADIYQRRGEYHFVKEQPYINGYEGT